jgi:hypothetical protein
VNPAANISAVAAVKKNQLIAHRSIHQFKDLKNSYRINILILTIIFAE